MTCRPTTTHTAAEAIGAAENAIAGTRDSPTHCCAPPTSRATLTHCAAPTLLPSLVATPKQPTGTRRLVRLATTSADVTYVRSHDCSRSRPSRQTSHPPQLRALCPTGNNHGVCGPDSNPVVDTNSGDIISGVCVCDNTMYYGDRCTTDKNSHPTCSVSSASASKTTTTAALSHTKLHCCSSPHNQDNIRNGGESDVDCGGPVCTARCPAGERCYTHSDCQTNSCVNGICAQPTCKDQRLNGEVRPLPSQHCTHIRHYPSHR